MGRTTSLLAGMLGLAAGVVGGWWLSAAPRTLAAPGKAAPDKLPRYTEEREAAALHFVKKHLPELLPVLVRLKKSSPDRYQREVRGIFYDTELLADLGDDPPRYRLELRIWKTENRARLLIAKLNTPNEAQRKKLQTQIRALAKELVNLDLKVLARKADQLDKELEEVKEEMSRISDNKEKIARDRYKGLLDKVKRPKK
jgi:hypothetical protein